MDTERTCNQCNDVLSIDEFRVTSWQPLGPYRSKTCRKCDPRADFPKPLSLDTSDGFVYVLLLPDGMIKIGWSANVLKRMRSIARNHFNGANPVLLGVVRGSGELETRFHERFDQFRLAGTGERFMPDREILRWAVSLGNCL